MVRYRSEKDIIEEKLWEIILRETKVDDDAGCDWFTIGNQTYIGGVDWHVSNDQDVANLVNAMNALNGRNNLIKSAYKKKELI